MPPASGPDRESESDVWPVLSEAVEAVEEAWQQAPRPNLAPFLPPDTDSRRQVVLVELIKVDQELRWRSGDRRFLEEYLAEWPEIGEQPDIVVDLLRAECITAATLHALPDKAELQSRFPTLCSRIELTVIAREAGSGRHSQRNDVMPDASGVERAVGDSTTDATVIQPVESDVMPSDFPEHAGSGVTHIEPPELPAAERSPDASNPGSLVGRRLDRYEVVELIGYGNMGAVYRAKDRRLDREVAVKVPLSHPQMDDEIRQRFLREAKSMAQISHPAVCSIFDVGDNPQLPWFAMELVKGETLGKWAGDRDVTQNEAATVVSQVAGGLRALHEAGVTHRDIKASNIMMRATGEPLLMDFGLASFDEDAQLTRTGSLLGTPAYMAPEVVEGGAASADPRSDVYSLGVVLYQLLTGRLPFTGPVTRIFAEIVYRDVEPPSQFRADLDPEMETVCLKAMAKKPDERFQSAAELIDVLAAWTAATGSSVTGLTAESTKPDHVETRKPRSSGRRVTGIVAATLALAVVALIVTLKPDGPNDTDIQQDAPGIVVFDTPDAGPPVDAHPLPAQHPSDTRAADVTTTVSTPSEALSVPVKSIDVSGFPNELQTLAARVLAYRGEDPFEETAKELRTELVEFRRKHVGTPLHHAAASLLPHLPWPADALRNDEIPPEELQAFACDGQDRPELVAILGTSRLRHWGTVSGVDVHPDGDVVVSMGHYGRLRLHDFKTGRRMAQIARYQTGTCLFGPDGRFVASGSGPRIELRDARTLELKRTLRGGGGPHGYPLAMSFSSDSRRVVGCFGGRRLAMFNVETGVSLWSTDLADGSYCTSIDLSHDDTTIAAAEENGRIGLWDAMTGTRLGELTTQTEQRTVSVAFSPSENLIAAGFGFSVGVWDSDTKLESWKRETKNKVTSVAFSPDGSRVAYTLPSNPQRVDIVNARDGKIQTTVIPHLTGASGNRITAVAFSPDSKVLVTGDELGIVAWHDAETGETESVPLGEPVEGVLHGSAVSPDGSLIATCGASGTVSVWDAASARLLWTEHLSDRAIHSLAFHPDGLMLAVPSVHRVIIKQPETGATIDELPIQSQNPPTVAFSPDGQRLAATGGQNETLVWDVGTWRTRHVLPTGDSCLAFTHDSANLLTASRTQPDVIQWDTDTGVRGQTFRAPQPDIAGISVHPLGRLVSVSMRGGFQLLDLDTGKWRSPAESTNLPTGGVAIFHPDGNRAIWNSAGVRVLDLATGSVVQRAVKHIATHLPVSLFPDGRHVVVPTSQGTAYVVRLEPLPRDDSVVKPTEAERGRRLAELQERISAGVDPDPLANETVRLRDELLSLAHDTQGTAEGTTAGTLARNIPWPADALRRDDIPRHELTDERGKGTTSPPELVAVLGDSRMRHWHTATAIVFSNDGSSLFSGAHDGTVIAQDSSTGNLQWSRAHLGTVSGVSLESQERWLAVAHGRFCTLLDPESGEVVKQLPEFASECRAVAFALDGSSIVASSAPEGPLGTFVTFDPATGQVVKFFRGHVNHVLSVSFHPDGQRIASASDDGTVRVWNATTGEELKTIRLEAEQITCVVFNPDGSRLAATTERANRLYVWGTESFAEIYRRDFGSAANSAITYSSDGRQIATGGDGSTTSPVLLDAATGIQIRAMATPAAGPDCLAFSPDGVLAAATGKGTIRIWDAATGDELTPGSHVHHEPLSAVAFSPDGRTLATTSQYHDELVLWDLTTRRPQQAIHIRDHFHDVKFLPGQSALLAMGTGLTMVNARTLYAVGGFPFQSGTTAISPDGRWLVTNDGGGLRLVNLRTRRVERDLAAPGRRRPVFGTDSQTVYAIAHDGTVSQWDLAGKVMNEFPTGTHTRDPIPALSPNGRTLAALSDQTRLVDLESGEVRIDLPTFSAVGGSFHPNGLSLITFNGSDISIWNLESPERSQLIQLPGTIKDIAVSPDGRHIATANANTTAYILRLGDAPTFQTEEISDAARGSLHRRVERLTSTDSAHDDVVSRPIAVPQRPAGERVCR